MTPAVAKLVTPQADLAKMRDTAYREGMRTLRAAGAAKVAAGLTTPEEIVKIAPPAYEG